MKKKDTKQTPDDRVAIPRQKKTLLGDWDDLIIVLVQGGNMAQWGKPLQNFDFSSVGGPLAKFRFQATKNCYFVYFVKLYE